MNAGWRNYLFVRHALSLWKERNLKNDHKFLSESCLS